MRARRVLAGTVAIWLALSAWPVWAQSRGGTGSGLGSGLQDQSFGGPSSGFSNSLGSSFGSGNSPSGMGSSFSVSGTRAANLDNPFANRPDPFSNSRQSGFGSNRPTTISYPNALPGSLGAGRSPFGVGQSRLGTARPGQAGRQTNGATQSRGIGRAGPQYATRIAFDYPAVSTAQVQQTLQEHFAQHYAASPSLPSAGNIQIVADAGVVVLKGEVRSAEEKKLAEALVRIEPGVRQVRNELEISVTPRLTPE